MSVVTNEMDPGQDTLIDVLRLDNCGTFDGERMRPLLISSKVIAQRDSLGSYEVKLQRDTLSRIISYLIQNDTKIRKWPGSQVCFLVRYRLDGVVGEYYVSYPEI